MAVKARHPTPVNPPRRDRRRRQYSGPDTPPPNMGRDVSKDFIPPAKPIIGDEERAAVDAVLRSGMLAQGAEVAAFEQEFSEQLLDGRGTVAVNAGTTGLHL